MPFGLVRLISTAWLALKSGAHWGLAIYAGLRAGAPRGGEHVVAISAGRAERSRVGNRGDRSVLRNRRMKEMEPFGSVANGKTKAPASTGGGLLMASSKAGESGNLFVLSAGRFYDKEAFAY